MWIRSTSFNVWVRYFVWNFKGTLWNSTQNIFPIHWKVWFLYNIEILRALKFKSSYMFLKRPPGHHYCQASYRQDINQIIAEYFWLSHMSEKLWSSLNIHDCSYGVQNHINYDKVDFLGMISFGMEMVCGINNILSLSKIHTMYAATKFKYEIGILKI